MPSAAMDTCYAECHNTLYMDFPLLLISSKQKRAALFIILQITSNVCLCGMSTT